MKIITNQSSPRKTPFAPQWCYHIGYEFIKNVNFKKVAQIILKKEKQILKEFSPSTKSSVDGYTGLGKKSLTSRYEHFNIFLWKEKEIQQLKKHVLDFHSRFLKEINIEGLSDFHLRGWANVMRKGEQIKAHLHSAQPTSYLSGHICVQCQETSTYYINPVNQLNEPYVKEIPNEVGQLVVFPTCVPHYTDTHQGNKERITVAFDLDYKSPL